MRNGLFRRAASSAVVSGLRSSSASDPQKGVEVSELLPNEMPCTGAEKLKVPEAFSPPPNKAPVEDASWPVKDGVPLTPKLPAVGSALFPSFPLTPFALFIFLEAS